MDWGAGRYEVTAATLEPAAEHVVGLAELSAGERVLDIGCGTGNAALACARAGAAVTGIDPAARLVDVARERAAAAGLEVTFVVGDAQALPFDDGSFPVVVSVFGVIFAGNAEGAIDEIVRVLAPGARAFVSAWLPEGAIAALMGACGSAMAAATGSPGPPRFPWHDREAVAEVAGRSGATVTSHEGSIQFRGDSADGYFATQEENHPMAVATRPLLESAGTYAAYREEGIAVLRAGNEDPSAFCVTSAYRVHEIRL